MLLAKVFAQISLVFEALATDVTDFVVVDVNSFDVMVQHFLGREKFTTDIARQPVGE